MLMNDAIMEVKWETVRLSVPSIWNYTDVTDAKQRCEGPVVMHLCCSPHCCHFLPFSAPPASQGFDFTAAKLSSRHLPTSSSCQCNVAHIKKEYCAQIILSQEDTREDC